MKTVVVTGFGPFSHFKINASWEVAKSLKNFELDGINLITEEVDVVYDTVEEKVPKLWEKFKPDLMVHIGVSAYASEITLESCARKEGYKKEDVEEKIPKNNEAHGHGAKCIASYIDVVKISQQFNLQNEKIQTIVSGDAGRFLCEFTYYTSLCVNAGRTIFIHVPDINKPYTVEEMSQAVKDIILLIIDQIDC